MTRSAALLLVVVSVLAGMAACGSDDANVHGSSAEGDGGNDAGGNDAGGDLDGGGSTTDAPSDGTSSDGEAGATATGFEVVSPDVELDSGQGISTCYYFRTSNTIDLAVKSWSSKQGEGIGHMALVFTDTEKQTPGTLSPDGCAVFGGQGTSWVYSAWTPQAGWSFPADDGAGKPLGKKVKAGQFAYLVIQMHNTTAAKLKSHVELDALGYDLGTEVTAAEPFVAYNADLGIPAMTSDVAQSKTCDVPTGAKFVWASMFAYKHAVQMTVKETGGTVVFQATDFANPGSKTWSGAFYEFPNDKAVYECVYDNGTTAQINSGPNVDLDENCMMLSYHFPATKPRLCVNDVLLP